MKRLILLPLLACPFILACGKNENVDEAADTEQDAGQESQQISCPLPDCRLVWNDEFESGDKPDPALWSYQVADAGLVNNELQTYVDCVPLLHYDNDGSGKRNWPYDAPFYLILNLAWGGSWGGMNGVDKSALPCAMEVEYVRVFQKQDAGVNNH